MVACCAANKIKFGEFHAVCIAGMVLIAALWCWQQIGSI